MSNLGLDPRRVSEWRDMGDVGEQGVESTIPKALEEVERHEAIRRALSPMSTLHGGNRSKSAIFALGDRQPAPFSCGYGATLQRL
jgi:hypothetical protein